MSVAVPNAATPCMSSRRLLSSRAPTSLKSDHWHRRLLRARRKRPHRRAAEKRAELARTYIITPHVPLTEKWRIAVRGSVTYFAVRRETHEMSPRHNPESFERANQFRLLRC